MKIDFSVAPALGTALLGLFALDTHAASASFAVIFDPPPEISISSTRIPVGGTVYISTSNLGGFNFSLSGDYVDTYYPGDYAAYLSLFDQYTLSDGASFTAPGSVQGSGGFGYAWYNLDGTIYNYFNGNTFTYNAPGIYTIEYSYGESLYASPLGDIFENADIWDINDRFIAGPFLQMFGGGIGGTGSFTVYVGDVPEPTTWAMMLLGFCGLGFMAYRRTETVAQNSQPVSLSSPRS